MKEAPNNLDKIKQQKLAVSELRPISILQEPEHTPSGCRVPSFLISAQEWIVLQCKFIILPDQEIEVQGKRL